MRLPVGYAAQAQQDLTDIFRYIAADNPGRARSYADELIRFCGRLGETPKIGRPRDDLGAGLRSFSFRKRQVVIYEILPDRIEILRIFSAGRDVQALLTDD